MSCQSACICNISNKAESHFYRAQEAQIDINDSRLEQEWCSGGGKVHRQLWYCCSAIEREVSHNLICHIIDLHKSVPSKILSRKKMSIPCVAKAMVKEREAGVRKLQDEHAHWSGQARSIFVERSYRWMVDRFPAVAKLPVKVIVLLMVMMEHAVGWFATQALFDNERAEKARRNEGQAKEMQGGTWRVEYPTPTWPYYVEIWDSSDKCQRHDAAGADDGSIQRSNLYCDTHAPHR